MQPQTALTKRVNAALTKAGFDPNQPRDEEGQWTGEGGGGGGRREDDYKRKRWEDMSRSEQQQAAADRILQLGTRAQLAQTEQQRAEAQEHVQRLNRMRSTDYDRWENSMRDWQNNRAGKERAANRQQEASSFSAQAQRERARQQASEADRQRYLSDREAALGKPLRGKVVAVTERAVRTATAVAGIAAALNQASVTSDYVTATRKLLEARDQVRELRTALKGAGADVSDLSQEIKVKLRVAQIKVQRAASSLKSKLKSAGPAVREFYSTRDQRRAERQANRAAASAAALREARRRTSR